MDAESKAAIEAAEEQLRQAYIRQVKGCPTTTCSDFSPEQKAARLAELWNDFDAYSPILADAQQRVAAFIRGDGPTALVLAGNVGCGKTHLARVVCKFYSQVDCRLLSEPDLIAHIQAGYNGEGETEDRILARLRCAKMLVLDDVGTAHVREQSQGWLEGIYWRILDRRAERQLPTLLTTNLDMAALRLRIGTRAMSRLMGMMQDQAGFVGMFGVPDYRTRGWR